MFQSALFDLPDTQSNQSNVATFTKVNGENFIANSGFKCEVKSQGKTHLRDTFYGDSVESHPNVNMNPFWSVKQLKGANKGKVSAYVKTVVVENPSLKTSEKG